MKLKNIQLLLFLLTTFMVGSSCSNKKAANKETVIAPMANVRLLPIEGAYNVRDMGGYNAADGKKVKWGMVFRSGDLNLLTENDLILLNSIQIKTFIDFRDSAEVVSAPDKTPASLVHAYHFPIEIGSIIEFKKITEENVANVLVEGNRNLVRYNQDAYCQFFNVLQHKEEAPVLFHCSAGKDRAGLGAALFLSSLGVDKETIIEDYLLTNEYIKDKYARIIEENPIMQPLLEARREYIEAAFETIDKEFEGMDNYLTKNLGIDIKKMRELYTE
jgi:Protein tyrosine/serine phosphatase